MFHLRLWQQRPGFPSLFMAIVLLLAACQAAPAATATPTGTLISTQTAAAAFTPSLVPTEVLPIATLGSAESTATALQATRIAPFLGLCDEYFVGTGGRLSPNGNWLICGYEFVLNRTGTQWRLPMSSFFGEEGVNYDSIEPIYWTLDGRYLYVAPVRPIGDSVGEYQPDHADTYFGLLQMDLETGEVDIVLPLEDGIATVYTTISISPTGRRLAYCYHRLVSIVDLKTGAVFSFEIPFYGMLGSDFTWSADGRELQFLIDVGGQTPTTYLAKVDTLQSTGPVLYAVTPEPTSTSTSSP